MALDQSVLSELLDAFQTGEGLDLIRESVRLVCQELIEAELTAQIGADRYERTGCPGERAQRAPVPGALHQGRRRGAGHPQAPEGAASSPPSSSPAGASTRPSMPWSWRPTCTGSPPGPSTSWSGPSGSSSGHLQVRGQPHLWRVWTRWSAPSGSGGWTTWPSPTSGWTPPTCTCASDHQVTSKAVVIATGVSGDGHREILGIDVGDSEDEVFWREFLRKLASAGGSTGVQLVISDQHAGLVAAIGRCFQGAAHQRCRVHFARNLLASIPKGHQEMVAAAFRPSSPRCPPEEMAAQWDHVAAHARRAGSTRAPALMAGAKEEVLAFSAFPPSHWRQIWSTNPLERLNKEIKRRCRVVGIFPNEASVIRLGGCRAPRHPRRVGRRRTAVLLRSLYGQALPRRG